MKPREILTDIYTMLFEAYSMLLKYVEKLSVLRVG